jgi:cyclohexanecarboxylate-CoA ligase
MVDVRVDIDPAIMRRYRDAGWWQGKTIVDYLKQYTAEHPDKVAIVGYRTEERETDVLSYRQLSRLVDRFAGALLELGIGPGDVVALQLPNWWHITALYMACGRIGAVITTMAPILRQREVRYILDRMDCKVCIVPDTFRKFDYASMLAELALSLPKLKHIYVIGEQKPEGTKDFDEFFVKTRWEEKHGAEELDRLAPDPDTVHQIMFTSGTTGEPKGVLHTPDTLDCAARVWPEMMPFTEEDVVLMAMTMGHQGGFLYGCHMPFVRGLKAVYIDVFDLPTILEAVSDEAVTWTVLPPATVIDASATVKGGKYNLSTLKYLACGGAPVPPHLVDLAKDVLGCRLYTVWGMTENGPVTILTPKDPPEMAGKSDGRVIPSMELKITDDDRLELPVGQDGRLLVRGPNNFLGYFERPELTAAAMDEDGWFDTGDVARIDKKGYIRITGRTKELIIRGGENIPVVEVEAALYQHPKVHEVSVIGVPDERLGERACAVVIPENDPPTLQELTGHLEKLGMSKHFWPERLEIVDAFPRTAFGKVQKFMLRDQILAASK